MATALNLTGLRFGELVVLRRGEGMYGRPSWVCACSCGKEVEVGRGNLRSGATTSCGCVRDSLLGARGRTHGLSNTGAYSSWAKMMQRCYDTRHPYYSQYGGAGVTVVAEWHTFEGFYRDMGDRPDGTTLDRKSGALGYFAGNCRWATRKEQANNTKSNHLIRYKRRVYTLTELAEEHGIAPATLRKRLLHMPVWRAISARHYERG